MIRKTVLCFFCVLLIFGKAQASPLSLKVTGGMCWIAGGDLSRNLSGWKSYYSDRNQWPYSFAFDVNELRLSWEGGVEIVYSFSPRFQVGLGLAYLMGTTEGEMSSSLEYEEDYFNSTLDFGTISLEERRFQRPRYSLRTIPVNLTLYYAFPLSRKVQVFAGLGIGLYSGKMVYREDYQYDFDYKDEKILFGSPLSFVDQYGTSGEYSEETRSQTFGLQGKAGLEFRVYKQFHFVLEIIARRIHFTNWEGTKRDAYNWDHTWGFWGANTDRGSSEEKSKGKLWMVQFLSEITGKSYPRLVFSEEEPIFSSYSEAKPARINLDGIAVRVGVRIGF